MLRIALATLLLALAGCAHNPEQQADQRRMESTMDDQSRAEKAREQQCGSRTGLGPTADQASCAGNGTFDNVGRSTSQALDSLSGSTSPGGLLGGR